MQPHLVSFLLFSYAFPDSIMSTEFIPLQGNHVQMENPARKSVGKHVRDMPPDPLGRDQREYLRDEFEVNPDV